MPHDFLKDLTDHVTCRGEDFIAEITIAFMRAQGYEISSICSIVIIR